MSDYGGAASALGIGLGNTVYNAWNAQKNRDAQAAQNQADRQQQEKLYRWERDDARLDWNTQNAYNDPKQQMERLRQAGLSPHLVYGKGADVTAMAVKSYSGEAPNQPAPKFDYTNSAQDLMSGFDMKFKQVQTDNVQADTDLKVKEQLVKDSQIAATLQNTAMTKFQLEQALAVKEEYVRKWQLENIKTEVDTEYTRNQDDRSASHTLQEVLNSEMQRAKTAEEIKKIKAEIDLLKNDKLIQEIELELRKNNLTPNSPAYQKVIKGVFDKFKKYYQHLNRFGK